LVLAFNILVLGSWLFNILVFGSWLFNILVFGSWLFNVLFLWFLALSRLRNLARVVMMIEKK
jgi:hypothetical protein